MLAFRLEQILWVVSALAQFAVFLRLLHAGLLRRYVWLAAYMLADVCVATAMVWIPRRTNSYAIAYMVTRPLLAALQVGIAIECYRRMWEHYRNADATACRIGCLAVSAAAFACLLLTPVEFGGVNWSAPWVPLVWMFYRYVGSCLASFLVISWLMSSRIASMVMRGNVVVNLICATAYFTIQALECAALNLCRFHQPETDTIGAAHLVLASATLVTWAILLASSGEAPPIIRLSPQEVDQAARFASLADEITRWPRRPGTESRP
jgi:hypothetical protein